MNSTISKHIIKTVFLILVVSFIGDKIIFSVLNKISDGVYSGQSIGKLNQYLQIKNDLDLIVYGSSRANHNVDPTKISKNSFNIGVDGSRLAYSATLIKLLSTQKEQIILLHIDPEYAFDMSYFGEDILALNSKYNRNDIIKKEINKLNQNNILQSYFWSLSYNNSVIGILKNYKKPNYDYKTYFGYDPIYVSENQRKILQNILNKDDDVIDCETDFDLNKIYDNYIDELNEFCKENNKVLIIFTSPKLDDKCKNDNVALSQILKQRNLNYYDLTDYFKDNKSLENWKDRTHLSNKGAELFTEKIRILLNRK